MRALVSCNHLKPKKKKKKDPVGSADAQRGRTESLPTAGGAGRTITSEVESQVREVRSATAGVPAPQPTSDAGKQVYKT